MTKQNNFYLQQGELLILFFTCLLDHSLLQAAREWGKLI